MLMDVEAFNKCARRLHRNCGHSPDASPVNHMSREFVSARSCSIVSMSLQESLAYNCQPCSLCRNLCLSGIEGIECDID